MELSVVVHALIPATGRQRQGYNNKFEVSLFYKPISRIARDTVLKKNGMKSHYISILSHDYTEMF